MGFFWSAFTSSTTEQILNRFSLWHQLEVGAIIYQRILSVSSDHCSWFCMPSGLGLGKSRSQPWSLWPHVTTYFSKDAVFSFSQSCLPFCSCFHFFLRIDKNSETLIFAVSLMWPYPDNALVVSPQRQKSSWDASAKSKDRGLTELGAIFMYRCLWQHVSYSNDHGDTMLRTSCGETGASTC